MKNCRQTKIHPQKLEVEKRVPFSASLTSEFNEVLCCDSFDRSAARLATMSSISFRIAPSAATSDVLLSKPKFGAIFEKTRETF